VSNGGSSNPSAMYLSAVLPHSPWQNHDVRNACGKHTIETIDVLVAFGEDERRASVPYCLSDLLADRSIPSLVVHRELIKRLELDLFILSARYSTGVDMTRMPPRPD
jgi:hypothetical protein